MEHNILLIMILALIPFYASAQTERSKTIANDKTDITPRNKPIEIVDSDSTNAAQTHSISTVHYSGGGNGSADVEQTANTYYADTTFHYRSMNPANYNGWLHPWYRSMGYLEGWPHWELHDGINVTLGASVFGEFGKGAHSGVGFSQQVTLAYAHHLALKGGDVIYRDGGRKGFTFLGGAYFNNVNYTHSNYKDIGFYGELSYRFDEHWEAALYGQKSFMDRNSMMPPTVYDMERLGDRIGASVRYNFNPSFSIQFSVETSSRPAPPKPDSLSPTPSSFNDGR